VSHLLRDVLSVPTTHTLRLVKGSHIVVPRIFAHRFAYIFQNADRRIVFAIPYEQDFTLIGTTDRDYQGDPAAVHIEPDEVQYLCAIVNRYFARQTTAADVVWSYAGVRPLLSDESSDPSSVTRDYALELELEPAPLLSIFGGKITTYRKLAESAVDTLARSLGSSAGPWTLTAKLPGGDLPGGSLAAFLRTVERRYPWMPAKVRTRYAHAYGTRIDRVVGDARSLEDMGEELLPELYEREVVYLCREEFARTVDDILWRRTKVGLHTLGTDISRVAAAIGRCATSIPSPAAAPSARRPA
jgi:glycerol-3-phosphate dehydrogenase